MLYFVPAIPKLVANAAERSLNGSKVNLTIPSIEVKYLIAVRSFVSDSFSFSYLD